MEAAIRFSQNSPPVGSNPDQRFLYVDVTGKRFQLCKISSRPTKRTIKHDVVAASGPRVPPFRAFDWHPTHENLIVVGQASGEATLLNLHPTDDDPGQTPSAPGVDQISFNIRSQRPSNAVALNSSSLLAAGLDRVRTDFCLNIWDYSSRLPSTNSTSSGPFSFTKAPTNATPEPVHKLAPGEPITSLKFFSSPNLLVAGVKGQFVRIYDLRDPASSSPSSPSGNGTVGGGLQFPTRCVHNLAIDWTDENYFASCFPSGDAMVCLWDRRMGLRAVSTASFGNESRGPEVSLELRNAAEHPETIWSLRFAKSKRGCLGVLSSTGHLKVYEIGKDFVSHSETQNGNHINGKKHDGQESIFETPTPQNVYLDRTQDIERGEAGSSATKDEKAHVVSFDFMTTSTPLGQPEMITLNGNGEIKTTSPMPVPEPALLSSTGFFMKGRSHFVHESSASEDSSQKKAAAPESMPNHDEQQSSSLQENLRLSDVGFTGAIPDFLTLASVSRHRCKEGYLLTPSTNRDIVSDNRWLHSLWTWIDRAQRIARNGGMVQDNLDLAYLGVFSLWMEEIPESAMKIRTLGPGPALSGGKKLSKAIEGLVRRLSMPVNRGVHSEYRLNRQLCLYVAGLSWGSAELENWTKRLVQQGQHTKAAFMALVASERKLVHEVLKSPNVGQREKMLGVAIAGAVKRVGRTTPTQSRRTQQDSDSDTELTDDNENWSSTISSLSAGLTDPYARAILAYVKSNDWSDVLQEESLPLKYRVCVALRHLEDTELCKYISQATKDAVREGDLEGIILTGTGTKEAFELLANYISRIGDLQSAVLALATAIPRYVNDESIVRKFNAWKKSYRAMMNSWGCRMERVRFDVAVQKVAVENGTGRRLIPPAKPQVKLVCSYCAGSIAHHDAESGDAEENGTKMHDTARNPLTPANAAAIGTVCPKCGRKLPRCGVCDLWLGQEDETYLKWHGGQKKATGSTGSADLAGSTHTIIGPGQSSNKTDSPAPSVTMAGSKKGSTGSNDAKSKTDGADPKTLLKKAVEVAATEDLEIDKVKQLDEMMARFTVFCVKCSHGFHAAHARKWFQGSPEEGRSGHKICPVPRCECVCYE